MPTNSGPVIVTLCIVTLFAAIVLRVSHGTSRRLVAREHSPDTLATYRRPASPERVKRQIDARNVRQGQALTAAKLTRVLTFSVALAWMLALTYGTALALDGDSLARIVALVAGLAAVGVAAFIIKPFDATFPPLPEREAYEAPKPDEDHDAWVDPETTRDRFARPKKKASPERRKRRKTSAGSRKNNRSR